MTAASTTDRAALLDALASAPQPTRRVVINRTRAATVAPSNRSGRLTGGASSSPKISADAPLCYPIVTASHPDVVQDLRDPDDRMVVLIKNAINESEITRRQMESAVLPDGTVMTPTVAYNCEYGLRKRGTITLAGADRWAGLLGKRIVVTLEDIDPE